MIKVNEIAFFGYPVTDRARARGFYEKMLGSKPAMDIDIEKGFWMEFDLPGGTLALSNVWQPSRERGGQIALEVDDFPTAIDTLKKDGVDFALPPLETPVCHLAVVTDPDGNGIVIHKRKPGHG